MKKLVHISANIFNRFPSETHTKSIWDELAKSVDEYHILARSTSQKTSLTMDGKLSLHLLPRLGASQFWFMFLIFHQLYALYRIKPNYIVCQCPVLGGVAASVYKIFYRNVIVTMEIHGEHLLSPRSLGWRSKLEFLFFRSISYFTFGAATTIRSLSESMTDNICKVYGAGSKRKIKLVPNRVDVTLFKPKKTFNLPNEIKFITVGRFSKIKNHLKLIDDLFDCNPNCKLTIVGNGSLKNDYETKIKEKGLCHKVIIIETLTHEELAEEYIKHDVYIHYSCTEAVPRVILEAQSCAVPVIAVNVGYINGVIIDRVNGFLLKEHSPKEILKGIEYLKVEGNYARVANNSLKSVVENYDSKIVFDRYRKMIIGKL
jgi:glycosyltransferase involved in cell wall biosynthesis